MQVHCLEAPTAHFLHPHAPQLRTGSHLSPQGTVPGLWLLPGREEVGSRAVKLGPRLGTSTSKDVREKTAASSLYRGLRREEGRCLSSGKCRTGLGDHEHRAPGPGLSVGSSTDIRPYAMGCGRLLCSSCEAAVLSRHRLLRGEGAVCPHQPSPEGIWSEPSMGGLLGHLGPPPPSHVPPPPPTTLCMLCLRLLLPPQIASLAKNLAMSPTQDL